MSHSAHPLARLLCSTLLALLALSAALTYSLPRSLYPRILTIAPDPVGQLNFLSNFQDVLNHCAVIRAV